MELKRTAIAGTLESSDIRIIVSPNQNGIEIELQSDVEKQYGDKIKEIMYEEIKKKNIENVHIEALDQGALDYAIKARIKTALDRAIQ